VLSTGDTVYHVQLTGEAVSAPVWSTADTVDRVQLTGVVVSAPVLSTGDTVDHVHDFKNLQFLSCSPYRHAVLLRHTKFCYAPFG